MALLGTIRKGSEDLEATDRISEWTRARFQLPADSAVLVSEVACTLPGCAPIETIIAFWTEEGAKRHHFKVFKPLGEVVEDDLPPVFMKAALAESEMFGCPCC